MPTEEGNTAACRTEVKGTIVRRGSRMLLDALVESSIHLDCSRCDIFPRVHESVLLELPIRFLCREDCKGLCSVCGADLNEKDCGCPEKEPDPRWQGLKKLLRNDDSK